MKIAYTITLTIFLCIRVMAQSWNLIWSDEFDGPAINSTNWKYDTGGSGFGNNELEYYTTRPENAKIDSGKLLIIAKKESYGGREYTSARLKTQGLRSFTYGKIEARIKLPVGKGLWPAFWMLGESITSAGWPKCGEIDIMEHINLENKNYGTIHWDNNGHAQYGGNVFCDESLFHTYSIEWSENLILWYVDGVRYWQASIGNNVNSTDEFHAPFFIILNLAVGGNWPGNPDSSTPFPDTMYVDYVRVYQQGTTGINQNPSEVSDHFSLLQNYPNPFNPTTSISFNIPSASFTTLKVFDVMGKEVSTLISENLSAGTYSRKWDAMESPSGVYFCTLQAGAYNETRKLVLLR